MDYCIVSDNMADKVLYFQVEDHIPFLSDHAKITLKLFAKFETAHSISSLQEIPPSWQWKDTSAVDFNISLSSLDIKNKIEHFKICNNEDVDSMVDNFNNIMYTVCERSLKRKSYVRSKRKTQHKKWFDMDLCNMREELLRRSSQYSKHPYDNSIKGSFFKFRKLYKRCCKQKYNLFKKTIIDKLDTLYENDPSEYWKLVKDLKEDCQESDPSSKILADTWVNHFTKLFSVKNEFKDLDSKYSEFVSRLEKVKTFSELDMRISEKEILKAIGGLKNKKSAGLDFISNEMLKAGNCVLIPCLQKIFNTVLSSGIYPSKWKVGYIKPLFKGEDPNDPNNYRGISVMPCVSKVFNSILNNRLQKYIDNGIIHEAQIGFQPKSRTSDHMFVVRTLTEKLFSKGAKLYACFVDFAKAFDSVLHSVLLYKLCKIGISGLFYNVIKNMYMDNFIHVKLDRYLTDAFSPSVGVRQGDNLSPNLFKIFINDLPSLFDSSDDQVSLNGIDFSCLLYADDLLLLSTSSKGLQNCIDKLACFCDNNGLVINLKKTNVMTFCKSGRISKEKYIYKGIEIQHVSTYKYLGIMLSSSGTFSYCQNDLYKRALKASFKISKVFGKLHQNVDTIIHLFDHTIKPILLYGSEIWATANTNSTIVKKDNYCLFNSFSNLYCDKMHVKFLKYVLGVHKKATNEAVAGELGRYPLSIDAICATVKYYQRLCNDKVSTLLSAAFQESTSLCNSNKNSWVASVHHIFKHIDISNTCIQIGSSKLSNMVKQKLVTLFKTNWCSKTEVTTGKLRTYALFKSRFCREPYIKIIKDRNVRSFFTKFRISAHKLNIEIGRYRSIPADQRICTLCQTNSVEDEIHFSMYCCAFIRHRNVFFDLINKINSNFLLLSEEQRFIWLMTSEDPYIVTCFAKFVFEIYNERSILLSQ